MSTRSGRIRQSVNETSPSRTRKGVSPPRSPARNKKSSPTSRVSTRSSPSRKSPSRKTPSKYPARKSPSRVVKEDKQDKEKSVPKSPTKRISLRKDATVNLEDISVKLEGLRSTRSRALEYSVKNIPSIFATESLLDEKQNGYEATSTVSDLYNIRNRRTFEDFVPRRSSRLREVDVAPDIRRSTSKSISESISKSVSKSMETYSDDDNLEDVTERKSESVSRKLSTPLSTIALPQSYNFEFFGRIGASVLFFIVPLTVFTILATCLKNCALKSILEENNFKSIAFWFDIESLILVLSQYAIQAILMLLPILGNKEVTKDGRKYYFNALFCSIFNITLFNTLDYYKVLNADMILNHTLQFALVSYVLSVFLAIILYLNSRKSKNIELNVYGNTGRVFYDFIVGREIQPYLLNINVKIWISRVCNITALILSLLIFRQGLSLQEKIEVISLDEVTKIHNKFLFKPTLLVFALMQIIYCLYFIVKEYKIISTFYWQYEGMGYLQLVASALYPFYFTVISKYVANSELELTNNTLIAALVLYGVGFLIMFISNNIKYEFRKNPLHPSLTRLESMPTFHGKKLLVSNLWGFLRHPNYTGDILIHIALALPGILTRHFMATAPALITILVLIHRSWRDHGRCKRRYGAAWNRYCKRVPSVLIPKII